VGAVTEQQIVAAIQAAAGSATPTPKAVATPTPVKATATPKVVKATATKVVKATATPKVVNAMTTTKTQPSIQVVTATKTPTASTQTVPEFSLLGLGAPALVVGAIYLFLRKR